jgi:hypothetical protein
MATSLPEQFSLFGKEPPQFPAYLGHSFFTSRYIPLAHHHYSKRMGNTDNQGKYLFCRVEKVKVPSNYRS